MKGINGIGSTFFTLFMMYVLMLKKTVIGKCKEEILF